MIQKINNQGKIRSFTREEYIRKLAASNEPLDIRLTNNYAFRKIFKNKVVLKGFLMASLNLTEDEIVDLEVMDPFEEGESEKEKEGILDIKVHMNNNTKVNIEMQNRYQKDWTERSIFYNCRMYTDGFLHSMSYGELEPCIHIGILDFVQMQSPGYHHRIMLMDEKSQEIYSSKFIFHVIQLKKLDEATEEEKQQELYRWARLLAAERWEDVCMEAKGNPYRELAKDEIAKIKQSEKERYLYLREEMARMDERSRMLTAIDEGERRERQKNIKATIHMCQKKGNSKEDVYNDLQEFYELTALEAQTAINEYWKEQ